MTRQRSQASKKPTPVGWRSRIVRYGEEPAGQLLGNSMNWRIHPQEQQKAAQALIGHEIGWIQGVIVNLRTASAWERDQGVATLIDGHMRAQLALKMGEETAVPVAYVDLTPKEERLALVSIDRLGLLTGTDDEQYDALLAGLADINEDVSAILIRTRRKKAKGLSHVVTPCSCCAKGCQAGCGCYRDE